MKFFLILLLTSCSNMFYWPSRDLYVDPLKFVKKVDDTWLTSKDGTKLNAWWIPSATTSPKGTIIFFHGNAENLSSHFINLAWITHEGYNLFIFDYRGYGMSQGEPHPRGIYEDSLAALDKGRELHLKNSPDKKLIIYGQSLGGTVALRGVADWPYKNEINLIVQDSTFMSYKDLAFNKLSHFWGTFLFSPLAYVLVSDEYASDKVIHKINNPMLMISGDQDLVVPLKFTEQIYKELKSPKKWFWKIKDGLHTDVFLNHDLKYRKKFLTFIDTL